MLRKLQTRLTYANVMATLAVFLVLAGGVAWALERNSVRSRHIVNGQVREPDLADLRISDAKRVDDPTPGDGLGNLVTLFRSGGVKVTGHCRDNASNVSGNDVANVQVVAEGSSISAIEANTGTETSVPTGSAGTVINLH